MTVIKVPKTPKSAFNKDRPASGLLQAQIEHLEAAVGINRPSRKAARTRPKRRTEGEAAAYIATLTRRLHPQLARPVQSSESVVPAAGASAGSSGTRRKRRPTKTAAKKTAKKTAAKKHKRRSRR